MHKLGQAYDTTLRGSTSYCENNKNHLHIEFPRSCGVSSPFVKVEEALEEETLTVDALAIDLSSGKIIDPHNGLKDIRDKVVRINNPTALNNSPTEVLEVIRFAANSKYYLDRKAKNIVRRAAINLEVIPSADVGEQLRAILQDANIEDFFKLAFNLGVLTYFLPRLEDAQKIVQTRKNGVTNVMEHCVLAAQHADCKNEVVRWAALYHDLGKITTKRKIGNKIRFFGHEKVSSKWAYKDLTDLGFGRPFAKQVAHLVLHHMFDGGPQLTDNAVRRLIKRVGKTYVYDLLDLREADSAGFKGIPTGKWKVDRLRLRIEKEINKNPFSRIGLDIDQAVVAKLIDATSRKEAELAMDLLLDTVLFHGLQNKEKDLTLWLSNVDFKALSAFCPISRQWLLEQQVLKMENRAEENADGTLKCGKYCQYKCDNQEQVLWAI